LVTVRELNQALQTIIGNSKKRFGESRVPSGGFMKSTRAPEDAELDDH
jgi:hypothetical protein